MVDITSKINTLRKAIASAVVSVSKQETIDAIESNAVPKGNIFEFSRAAGLLAIKKTYEVIPDCHPLPIEFAKIHSSLSGLNIIIEVEVHTIYKTGVEVEAMHGASVVALTIYDMLKPIDKGVEIKNIKLVSKSGGKSDKENYAGLKGCIIVCSDSVSSGKAKDTSGILAKEMLTHHGLEITESISIPDDFLMIQEMAKSKSKLNDLLVFIGGTGLSFKDLTPDALKPLIDREIPGISETARAYGQERMPKSMLSRGIAGFMDQCLVLTTPGSPNGVRDTIQALFPHVLHVFKIKDGQKH